ncbi:FAD-dependent monooxygenase [Oricola thermophila]|uniref:FAD-dependent monooxygenase n=1 Tax=Oricola thermophila TaxID=2742145 RepID=A0A6N1VBK2_9HYPH|nr:FAD-dependent monooxygenase [Oricola thermophila]QKV18068.1 FAD-dependent monooxygenase [Oricola thermophila]
MKDKTHILVAGAGIAGLTTALALARRGIGSTIVEAFSAPSEVGAGLQIAPNATRILREIGVLDALAERAVAPTSIRLGDAPSGRILLDMAITPKWLDRMGAPYLTAHRASLHGVLYTAAVADPLINILTGHKVADIRQDADRVTTRLACDAGEREIVSDLLVGADGIWSKVREAIPGAARPRSTGRIAWRAIGPASAASANKVTAWMAPESHLVTYPVRNSETLNIVAVTHGKLDAHNWANEADGEKLARLLASARSVTDLGALDKASWTTWPLSAVAPSAPWHHGRILLVGDAAHGMEPFAAQGAAMAIEDGYAAGLAISASRGNHSKALNDYRALRLDRVLRVARRTAFNRWTYHQSGAGRIARNMFFQMRSPEAFFGDLDWLYGYRITE